MTSDTVDDAVAVDSGDLSLSDQVEATTANAIRRDGQPLSKVVVPPLVMFVVVVGLWYFVSYALMSERRRNIALPPLHRVVQEGLFPLWDDKTGLRPILTAMLTTGRVALIGLAISVTLGMLVAILMNFSKSIERAVFPYAVVIQTLPILALVPIIILWFDFGLKSRVLACVLIAIFPIITNTLFGLQSADRTHHDLFTLNRTSRVTRLIKMELPGALPATFTGLRIAAGGSVIGAIVGDFFFRKGDLGIGRLMDNYQKDLRVEELFVAAGVSSLFGVVIFVIFGWLSNRALRSWHDSVRTRT
jgi:NitT/TauT family transport system permease protein